MLVSMWRKENPRTPGEYKLEQLLWKIVQNFFQKLKKKKKEKKNQQFYFFYTSQENKMTSLKRYMNTDAHSRIFYDSQNMKATQVSSNRRIDMDKGG